MSEENKRESVSAKGMHRKQNEVEIGENSLGTRHSVDFPSQRKKEMGRKQRQLLGVIVLFGSKSVAHWESLIKKKGSNIATTCSEWVRCNSLPPTEKRKK